MLTTVPVSSVSLTGLPSPNWTHLWRELLPSPWWRGVDLAELLGMTTMPPLTEPTVELESGRTNFPVHAVAAHHWTGRRRSRPRRTSEAMNTSMPRSLCRSLAVMFGLAIQCWWTDWTFTRIFGRGATVKRRVLNCIPMNWKSWLGVRTDFSKLMIQPRNWRTLMVV